MAIWSQVGALQVASQEIVVVLDSFGLRGQQVSSMNLFNLGVRFHISRRADVHNPTGDWSFGRVNKTAGETGQLSLSTTPRELGRRRT